MSAADLLDDAEATVGAVALPWLAVFWLTALPLRMLQVDLLLRVIALGDEVATHGRELGTVSVLIGLATLPWVWGRAVFVRACRTADGERTTTTGAPLRVPAAQLLALLYVTLLAEAMLLALAWTFVAWPVAVLVAGVAAACHADFDRPGPLAALATVGRATGGVHHLFATLLVLAVAWLVAWVNLLFLLAFLSWCATALTGLDVGRWQVLLSPGHPPFLLWTAAGATLLVEPFWLAAASAFVERSRSRASGADLVRRLDALVAAEERT